MSLLLMLVLSVHSQAFADAPRYEYRKGPEGKFGCFDSKGRPGLNVDTFAPCSDFRGKDLRDADLSNRELSFSSFAGADLSGANLAGSDFYGVDFTDAVLQGAVISSTTALPFSRSTAYDQYGMIYRGRTSEAYCYYWEYGFYCENSPGSGGGDGDYPG